MSPKVVRVVCVYQVTWVFEAIPSMLETLTSTSWLLDWLRGSTEDSYSVEDEAARIIAIEEKEREFHGWVREHIICLLLFIALYLFSYWLISRYKERTDSDSLYAGEEDYIVYRISVWMCTTSLAGSIGSIALLPFSVLGAELLQRYPSSYYLQWLSWSLLHSLWNYVFFLSNISLFVLLPFAYFFIESQGFNKKRNGVLQRAYETGAVCALLVLLLLCLSDLIFTLILPSTTSSSTDFVFSFGLSSLSVPLLYSIVSLLGVLLLLISTPLGFTKMFGIVADLAQTRPPPTDDITVERLELFCQRRSLTSPDSKRMRNGLSNGYGATPNGYSLYSSGTSPLFTRRARTRLDSGTAASDSECVVGPPSMINGRLPKLTIDDDDVSVDDNLKGAYGDTASTRLVPSTSTPTLITTIGASSASSSSAYSSASSSPSSSSPLSSSPTSMMTSSGEGVRSSTSPPSSPSTRNGGYMSMPLRQKSLRWYQNVLHSFKYTLAIIGMLTLTAITVLLVLINALKLLLGYRELPMYAQYLEVNSRHAFGLVGVAIEIVIIVYIMATSVVGVYTMPILRSIKPKRGGTTMTAVIINCSIVVVLTSALPVLASTLGLTTFDLLGLYTSLRWLSNFKLVLTYNVLFAIVTTLVVVNRATSSVRSQLLKSLRDLKFWRSPPPVPSSSTTTDDCSSSSLTTDAESASDSTTTALLEHEKQD